MDACHSLISVDSTPIKAVLFDMDGVLLDTEVLAMQAFLGAAGALTTNVSKSFARQLIGLPYDACRRLTEETYGAEVDTAALFARQTSILRDLMASEGLRIKKGVVELLDFLDLLGLRRAVVTSSRRQTTLAHLQQVGLIDRFDVLITRDDVTCGKPHPEPYLRAAEALGVGAVECLALEDSPNGARSAYAAQIRVIVVPDLVTPNEEIVAKALAVMRDLTEVQRFIAHHSGH